MGSKPCKIFNIWRVGQQTIPWSTRDWFLWPLGIFKLLNEPWLNQLETKFVHHLPVFRNDLFGFRKLKSFEEVGKILIDIKLINWHGETPFEKKFSRYDGSENDNENASHTHDEKWWCLVDLWWEKYWMISEHVLSYLVFVMPFVLEELLIVH